MRVKVCNLLLPERIKNNQIKNSLIIIFNELACSQIPQIFCEKKPGITSVGTNFN